MLLVLAPKNVYLYDMENLLKHFIKSYIMVFAETPLKVYLLRTDKKPFGKPSTDPLYSEFPNKPPH